MVIRGHDANHLASWSDLRRLPRIFICQRLPPFRIQRLLFTNSKIFNTCTHLIKDTLTIVTGILQVHIVTKNMMELGFVINHFLLFLARVALMVFLVFLLHQSFVVVL